MKVLIISPSKGLYDSQSDGYNGVGWVASLQQYLEKEQDIELAMAFVTPAPLQKEKRGNTMYYPIHIPDRSGLKKLYYYWQGYKKDVFDKSIVILLKEVIEDFTPDIIHIFGTESNLGYIIGETDVPCVVHIQGILSTVLNVYFPLGLNVKSFVTPTNIREYWFRNGIVFNYNRMVLAAEREKAFIRKSKYIIGRTEFDKQFSRLYNSDIKYFHVDEILRDEFYKCAKWNFREGKLRLVSTLSPTIYKGVDIVLKTASILKECNVDFEWTIIGINKKNSIVSKIERYNNLFAEDLSVSFAGIRTAQEIVGILQESTIYVHPSYIDNSPNSLCEAQYIGMPTIATNVGGIPTMMNFNYEYMVSPVNPYSLAVKILDLFSQITSGRYVNGLEEIACKRHNPEKIMRELKDVYSTIISEHKKCNERRV